MKQKGADSSTDTSKMCLASTLDRGLRKTLTKRHQEKERARERQTEKGRERERGQ